MIMTRTTLPLLATLAISLGACGGDDKPKAPPEPPPTPPKIEAKGTSIELGDGGVKVESKDLELQLRSDTARVVLPLKER